MEWVGGNYVQAGGQCLHSTDRTVQTGRVDVKHRNPQYCMAHRTHMWCMHIELNEIFFCHSAEYSGNTEQAGEDQEHSSFKQLGPHKISGVYIKWAGNGLEQITKTCKFAVALMVCTRCWLRIDCRILTSFGRGPTKHNSELTNERTAFVAP